MNALEFVEKKLIAPVVLGIAFFLLILPIGIIMRLFGADPMRRSFDDSVDSYRVPSQKTGPQELEKTR